MPRAFYFSLERVLEYRVQLEEQAVLALAKAQEAYKRQIETVKNLRMNIESVQESMRQDKDGNADSIWLWRNYLLGLQQDLTREEAKSLELAQVLNKARREAVYRSKERKLLEKLKTNQMIQHEEDQKLQEQKEFDEMATIRYGRETL